MISAKTKAIYTSALLGSIILGLLLPIFSSQAAEATMFFSSGAGVFQTGKTFTARFLINSGGTAINAAESKIEFDKNFLKIEKLNYDKSIFSLWTTKPKFSNASGTIEFGGGIPGETFNDSAGLIFEVTFKALKNGKTEAKVASTSQILTADGQGDNIYKQLIKGAYNLGSYSSVSAGKSLAQKLSGQILLQVEENGEAWYIYPTDNKRYYLGRPLDAFTVMRKLGLGATHKYIETYKNKTFPKTVSGKILLDVEKNGEAYYIYPKTRKAYYLGRPDDAFEIMRQLGLGINNESLNKIYDWAI